MDVVSVIAANGTGHFRRSIGVLDCLLERTPGMRLTVFCTSRHLRVMKDWGRLRTLIERGATFRTDIECGFPWPLPDSPADLLTWRDRLGEVPDVQTADVLISDNLGGVLAFRSDAVLMGSFLWSDVLADSSNEIAREFVRDETDLLREHRPPMLCVAGIATPGVLASTRAVTLPWMCERPAMQPRVLSTAPRIGICGGTTDAASKEAADLVQALAPRFPLAVDAAIPAAQIVGLPGVATGLLRTVALTEVDVVLCRPGAGTVMDCVATNTPFITFAEPGSPEMRHIADTLASQGIAERLPERFTADMATAAVERLVDSSVYGAHSRRLNELPKDGLEQAARWLAEYVQGITDRQRPSCASA